MTESQKETLRKIRLAGKSYSYICRVLGGKGINRAHLLQS